MFDTVPVACCIHFFLNVFILMDMGVLPAEAIRGPGVTGGCEAQCGCWH